MCGIAGIFGEAKIDPKLLKPIMQNRGPDNFGYYQDSNLTLAHSRLSIIDLSDKSNQPLENDRFVFAFN